MIWSNMSSFDQITLDQFNPIEFDKPEAGFLESFGESTSFAFQHHTTGALLTQSFHKPRSMFFEERELSEDEWQGSGLTRPGFEWREGLTENEAIMMARLHDQQRDYAEFEQRSSSGTGRFLGTMTGAMLDPINLITIPLGGAGIAGRGLLSAVGRGAVIGAGTNMAIEGAMTPLRFYAADRMQYEYGYEDAALDVVFAAGFGSVLGGVGGALGRMLASKSARPRSAQKAADVAEEATSDASAIPTVTEDLAPIYTPDVPGEIKAREADIRPTPDEVARSRAQEISQRVDEGRNRTEQVDDPNLVSRIDDARQTRADSNATIVKNLEEQMNSHQQQVKTDVEAKTGGTGQQETYNILAARERAAAKESMSDPLYTPEYDSAPPLRPRTGDNQGTVRPQDWTQWKMNTFGKTKEEWTPHQRKQRGEIETEVDGYIDEIARLDRGQMDTLVNREWFKYMRRDPNKDSFMLNSIHNRLHGKDLFDEENLSKSNRELAKDIMEKIHKQELPDPPQGGIYQKLQDVPKDVGTNNWIVIEPDGVVHGTEMSIAEHAYLIWGNAKTFKRKVKIHVSDTGQVVERGHAGLKEWLATLRERTGHGQLDRWKRGEQDPGLVPGKTQVDQSRTKQQAKDMAARQAEMSDAENAAILAKEAYEIKDLEDLSRFEAIDTTDSPKMQEVVKSAKAEKAKLKARAKGYKAAAVCWLGGGKK